MVKATVLPRRVDLRARLMSVHDQGERPTCLAFAVTAAHELIRASSAAVNEDLSEEALYWGGKQLDQGVRDGTSFSAAQGALPKWGQPLEAVWPYDPLRDESRLYRLPNGVRPGSRGWHRAGLRRIQHTVSSLRRELASERIVALGLVLTRGFYYPVAHWIPEPRAGQPTLGGHAVAIVGYDDNAPNPGRGGFLVRNSWGDSWADRGYGWLPYQYVQQLGKEAWIIDV